MRETHAHALETEEQRSSMPQTPGEYTPHTMPPPPEGGGSAERGLCALHYTNISLIISFIIGLALILPVCVYTCKYKAYTQPIGGVCNPIIKLIIKLILV